MDTLQRVTLTSGTERAVTFDSPSKEYIVKNFSEADVYVDFESGVTTDSAIKISSGAGQICLVDGKGGSVGATRSVYLLGEGEVEVQQL